MNLKRIALIGYSPATYFQRFGQTLEDAGFEVYWVHITRSAAIDHKSIFLIPSTKILDTTAHFYPDLSDVERCKKELAALECGAGPRINDIILMDRILRIKSNTFALCYLNHLQHILSKFFIENGIALASSGRDSALQMISMLVCKKLNILWVAPTRVRIPQEMYMFTTGHETSSILNIRVPTNEDRLWAEDFLEHFNSSPIKPALKLSARSVLDTIKLVPKHAKVFLSLIIASHKESGNDYSRYTISCIIMMYLKRRFNLIMFKLLRPFSSPGKQPFCLYALHTQPESSIDVAGSHFSDQIALITFISRALPVSHELYVKVHPTDVDGKSLFFYKKIARLPGVKLINYDVDSKKLVKKAAIIFTLTGTIGYEAGLMGKKVVTFAKNYYNSMPTIHYCDSPPKLSALIESLLEARPPEKLNESIIAFLANLKAQSFMGEFNRMFLSEQTKLTTNDLNTLVDAYNSVFDSLGSATSKL
jgi:hypothetical protein